MAPEYVLITVTEGDGTVDCGYRLQSIRFRTYKAAEDASKLLARWLRHSIIVED